MREPTTRRAGDSTFRVPDSGQCAVETASDESIRPGQDAIGQKVVRRPYMQISAYLCQKGAGEGRFFTL